MSCFGLIGKNKNFKCNSKKALAFKVFSNLPSEFQIEITFFEGQSLTEAYGLNKF